MIALVLSLILATAANAASVNVFDSPDEMQALIKGTQSTLEPMKDSACIIFCSSAKDKQKILYSIWTGPIPKGMTQHSEFLPPKLKGEIRTDFIRGAIAKGGCAGTPSMLYIVAHKIYPQ